jgi:mono/diheme cytochrome c family protein
VNIKKVIKLAVTAGIVIGAVLFIGFIIIQFVPIDRNNPPVAHEPDWDSPQTRALMEKACFDCHSNETRWPWYSKVAPASWVVVDHVQEGREELNLSEWGLHEAEAEEAMEEEGEEVEEMVNKVRKGKMPLPSYLLLHPEARLTDAEIEQLIQGIEATFGPDAKAAINRH